MSPRMQGEPSVVQALQDAGFQRIANGIREVAALGATYVENAGTDREPRCAAYPSHLFFGAEPQAGLQLIVDVGGSNFRVTSADLVEGQLEYRVIVNEGNDSIGIAKGAENALDGFLKAAASRIAESLEQAGLSPGDVESLKVIWSNDHETYPENHGSVGARVVRAAGYVKNEPFVPALYDGLELGPVFLRSFSEGAGIAPERVVFLNDTEAVLAHGGNAGVVASSGFNTTILKDSALLGLTSRSGLVACNAEFGDHMIIPDRYLSDAERASEKPFTLEGLSGGNLLPAVFVNHIHYFSDYGVPAFRRLAHELASSGKSADDLYGAKDLSLLMDRQFDTFLAEREGDAMDLRAIYNEEVLEELAALSSAIIDRSARLAAVMIYSAISNQLGSDQRTYSIALDSRLAIENPLFASVLSSQLDELMPAGKEIELRILQPVRSVDGESISVATQGAALARAL